MATVSEICEALAQEIPMALNDVQKYARALISSGDLPKAIGRSVPETTMQDRVKLILAIACAERPSQCVEAMRDRYEAPSRDGQFHECAGDLLAEQLRQIASGSVDALQIWNYSDVEVSRTGNPRVKFRVNENLRHFDDFGNSEQPEFIGGTYTAAKISIDAMVDAAERYAQLGLAVSAFIPGKVLITLAFGGVREAANALIPIRKEAWRRREEQQDKMMEAARAEGKIAVRGTAADILKAIEEHDRENEE